MILSVNPEHGDSGHAAITLEARRELDRGARLQQREERAAEESRLRDMVSGHLDTGNYDASIQHARLLLEARPGARTLRFLRRIAERADKLRPFRVAMLSSFSMS